MGAPSHTHTHTQLLLHLISQKEDKRKEKKEAKHPLLATYHMKMLDVILIITTYKSTKFVQNFVFK